MPTPLRPPTATPATFGELDILFADAALLVIDKPAGMLSVPGRGAAKADCLATRVQADYADALVVHRLDMATSGLLVMARGQAVQRQLSKQFIDRRVDKHYLAVVAGRPTPATGEIDLPIGADWPNRPRQRIDHATGKASLTRYRTVHYDSAADASWIELTPLTGRTHQLRVHLQAIGHPILGDALYADAGRCAAAPRLLLHAGFLGLTHPLTSARLEFSCPAPF